MVLERALRWGGRRNLRVVALLLVCALTVVATSGVAAAKSVSPETWTTKFCNALDTWGKKVGAISAEMKAIPSQITDLAGAKDLLVKDLTDDANTTAHLAQTIQRAGIPSVPNGKKLSAILVNAAKKGQKQLQSAVDEAKTVPTDNPSTFVSAFSTVVSKIGSDPITPGLTAAQKADTSGKLGQALERSAACKALGK